MAFIASATKLKIAEIMQKPAVTFTEPADIQAFRQVHELPAAQSARPRHSLSVRDELERELSEPLLLLERLFPNEAALERKIACLKRILAHADLEEYAS